MVIDGTYNVEILTPIGKVTGILRVAEVDGKLTGTKGIKVSG